MRTDLNATHQKMYKKRITVGYARKMEACNRIQQLIFIHLVSIFQKSGVGQAIGNQTFIVMAFRLIRIRGPIAIFSFLNKLQFRTRKQLSCIISHCIAFILGSCIKSVPQCAGCLDHRTCQRCQEGFLMIESYWGALCVASCPGGFTKIQTEENGLVCKKSKGVCFFFSVTG